MISYRVPDTGPASKNGDGCSVRLRDGLVAAGYTVFLDVNVLQVGCQEVRLWGTYTSTCDAA